MEEEEDAEEGSVAMGDMFESRRLMVGGEERRGRERDFLKEREEGNSALIDSAAFGG